MKPLKIILIFLFVISFGIAFYIYSVFEFLDRLIPDPIEKSSIITSDKCGDTIYVFSKNWGISLNHHEILFSNEPFTDFDTKRANYLEITRYISIYYSVKDDTLFLYSNSPLNLRNANKLKEGFYEIIESVTFGNELDTLCHCDEYPYDISDKFKTDFIIINRTIEYCKYNINLDSLCLQIGLKKLSVY